MDVSTFTAHRRALITPAGQIAYTEFGDGPAVLFVHGLATGGLMWRHVIEQVSDTSRCIAIDLPAHGGTPQREDLSVGAIADVLEELCDGLRLGQVDLVANDTGGAISQIFAARYPQRLRSFTLTNCDTDGNFPPQWPGSCRGRRTGSPCSRSSPCPRVARASCRASRWMRLVERDVTSLG